MKWKEVHAIMPNDKISQSACCRPIGHIKIYNTNLICKNGSFSVAVVTMSLDASFQFGHKIDPTVTFEVYKKW